MLYRHSTHVPLNDKCFPCTRNCFERFDRSLVSAVTNSRVLSTLPKPTMLKSLLDLPRPPYTSSYTACPATSLAPWHNLRVRERCLSTQSPHLALGVSQTCCGVMHVVERDHPRKPTSNQRRGTVRKVTSGSVILGSIQSFAQYAYGFVQPAVCALLFIVCCAEETSACAC